MNAEPSRGDVMHTAVGRYAAHCSCMVMLALALLVTPSLASAQPVEAPETYAGDLWSRPRVTGDWGGLRDELAKKGIVLDVEMLRNLPRFDGHTERGLQ